MSDTGIAKYCSSPRSRPGVASGVEEPAGARSGARVGVAVGCGTAGMVSVGGSAAVSAVLVDAPALTAQAVRYAVACALLVGFARATGRRIVVPRGRQWLWLLGVSGAGLVGFNIALVYGSRHAEPAVFGVAVACVPLFLAVIGPLARSQRPVPSVLVAAAVVSGGAVVVQGAGRSDAIGVAWAVMVFVCELGFTLLAVPVLDRLGPVGVSVHTTWLAAVGFAVLGLPLEGPAAVCRLRTPDVLAAAYLAVAVTAVAFVLWYTSVERLGAARAGLLTGVAPVTAAVAGVALGGPWPTAAVWTGVVAVAAGLGLGLRARSSSGP